MHLNDVLSLQGLTGPDGRAGKDGPPGDAVSISKSFVLSEKLRKHFKMHLIYFSLPHINESIQGSHESDA